MVSLYLHVVTGEDSLSAISLSFKPVPVYLTKEIQDVTFLERKFPKIESKSLYQYLKDRHQKGNEKITKDIHSFVNGDTIFNAEINIPSTFINQTDIYPYEVNSPDAS